MSKVGVVTDSNSGITSEVAQQMGIYSLPMPFTIDKEEYLEGINLTIPEFFHKLKGDYNVATSQPSPMEITKLWDKALQDFDEIVFIPMSSGLSGECQTATMLAEDYEGKVVVINNQRISVTQKQSVRDALYLAQQGKSAKDIKKILEDQKFDSSIYITIDDLSYLRKGGRLTPAVAILGNILKIKPVLQIQGEKLDAFAKARTVKATKTIMIDAVKSDLQGRFKDIAGDMKLCIAHTDNYDAAMEFKKEVEAAIPGYIIEDVDDLSLSVSCHIGPGALALACVRVVK